MRHSTYKLLRRAHLGDVDTNALFRTPDSDPYLRHTISLLTETDTTDVLWDTTPFTLQFRSVPARERLDQTVVTFLLRIVAIVKAELYVRSFQKPGSWGASLAWIQVLKDCTFTILTLAYDLHWTSERFLQLDEAVLSLVHDGQPDTLRRLMQQLGITMSRETPFEAELLFGKLNFLNVIQFGSFFWRLLHWMAEAVVVRGDDPDVALAKAKWKSLVTGPLYRLLRCFICMDHLQILVQELRPQLLDDATDYPLLWYNIHNRVSINSIKKTPPYSEEEFSKDVLYMREGLEPK